MTHAKFTVDAFRVTIQKLLDPTFARENRGVVLFSYKAMELGGGGHEKGRNEGKGDALYSLPYFLIFSLIHGVVCRGCSGEGLGRRKPYYNGEYGKDRTWESRRTEKFVKSVSGEYILPDTSARVQSPNT